MSNNRHSDDSWIFFVIAVVVAIGFAIVWKFSTLSGLDMRASASVIGLLILVVVLTGMSWKYGEMFEPIRPGKVWPVLLALLWSLVTRSRASTAAAID